MSKIFNKFKFPWEKPKLVIIAKSNREMIKKFIYQILDRSFNLEKEVLFVDDLTKVDLSKKEYLILNFDDNNIPKVKEDKSSSSPFAIARAIKEETSKVLTFGFQEGADFQATDLIFNGRTNFKVNYKGNIVPFWLDEILDKEQIYAALTAVSVGIVFGLNLIEISQALTSVTK